MPKSSKLLTALERHKGKDHRLEHQKKLQKQAAKRKRQRKEAHQPSSGTDEEDDSEDGGVPLNGQMKSPAANDAAGNLSTEHDDWASTDEDDSNEEEDEDDESDIDGMNGASHIDLSTLDDSFSSSSEDSSEGDEGDAEQKEEIEDAIALSDIESLASEDKGDIVPHQRLTINNKSALLAALKRIAMPSNIPFSENQTITSDEPVLISDVEDDLSRELAFYKQSLHAAGEGRRLLRKEGLPFSRPPDYFAEMVKSDEHMGIVKRKLVDEAAGKKAAADARRQRDLKKFGKAVQVAKLQERDRQKRETLEKISSLKRKRRGAEIETTHEEDLFDVGLEDDDTGKSTRRAPSRRDENGKPNFKRQKKNEKFGFGGKKRFAKSGDAISSADMRDFSSKRMKGKKPQAGSKRPGKARRMKSRG